MSFPPLLADTFTAFLSTFTFALIAVERCCSIALVNRRLSTRCVLCAWAGASALAFVPAIMFVETRTTVGRFATFSQVSAALLAAALGVVCFCYCMIAVKIIHAEAQVSECRDRAQSDTGHQRTIAIRLLLLTALFGLCWAPGLILWTMQAAGSSAADSLLGWNDAAVLLSTLASSTGQLQNLALFPALRTALRNDLCCVGVGERASAAVWQKRPASGRGSSASSAPRSSAASSHQREGGLEGKGKSGFDGSTRRETARCQMRMTGSLDNASTRSSAYFGCPSLPSTSSKRKPPAVIVQHPYRSRMKRITRGITQRFSSSSRATSHRASVTSGAVLASGASSEQCGRSERERCAFFFSGGI